MLDAVQLVGDVTSADVHLKVKTEQQNDYLTKMHKTENVSVNALTIPPKQPCIQLDWSDRRSWAKRQKWRFQRE